MTSTRPTRQQLDFDFSDEVEANDAASKLRQEQSSSAVMEKSALDSISFDLMEKIVDDGNMERAWKKVKANRGAPGPDGITLDEFFESFRHQWPEVRRQLLEGTYRPGPARRKSISKPDGNLRDLGHSKRGRSRDSTSHPDNPHADLRSGVLRIEFGFRPNRSAQEQSSRYNERSAKATATASIWICRKFFDRVQHDVLLSESPARSTTSDC